MWHCPAEGETVTVVVVHKRRHAPLSLPCIVTSVVRNNQRKGKLVSGYTEIKPRPGGNKQRCRITYTPRTNETRPSRRRGTQWLYTEKYGYQTHYTWSRFVQLNRHACIALSARVLNYCWVYGDTPDVTNDAIALQIHVTGHDNNYKWLNCLSTVGSSLNFRLISPSLLVHFSLSFPILLLIDVTGLENWFETLKGFFNVFYLSCNLIQIIFHYIL